MDVSESNEIILYLLKIHPRHWTTFGNRTDIPDSRWSDSYEGLIREYMILTNKLKEEDVFNVEGTKLYYGNLPIGKKFPMYGISRNNIAESVANQTKMNNIRMCIPPIAVGLWINSALDIVKDYMKEIKKVNGSNIPFTYLATRSMTQSRERFKNSSVTNVIETTNIISVILNENCGKHNRKRKVMVLKEQGIKCSCSYFNQYEMLCPHILAAMQYLKQTKMLDADQIVILVNRSYKIFMCVDQICNDIEHYGYERDIKSDLYDVVGTYEVEDSLLPPPAYKHSTISGQKRRFAGKGEVRSNNTQRTKVGDKQSSRYTKGGQNTRVKYYNNYELKYYRSLTEMGFFDIKQPFNEHKIDIEKKYNTWRKIIISPKREV